MSKRLLVILTVISMLMSIPLTAASAAATASSSSEAQSVKIELSVGSSTVKINGEASTIQKPVKVNGTTLVPLSVITKAFGAKLKLENNKKITLTFNSTTVVLTIGSNKVTVNGKVSTLPAAPTIVNSVTMVPVRVIAQAFGADVAVSGNKITITGKTASESSQGTKGTTAIDSDAGKTKIGDSYWGWSMQYPTDLTLLYQSDNGDWTSWTAGTDDPNLIVGIEDVEEELSTDELREYIEDYFDNDEIVMEKKTISVNGTSFERYVTKSRSGWFYEYRAVQKGKRIYIVMAGLKAESREALNKYQAQLDSFTLSFDSSDRKLKDVTKVVDGMVTIHDKDFGLQIKMPANWHRLEQATSPFFYSDEGFIGLSIYSVNAGETAEQWRASERTKLENRYAEGYLKDVTESTINLSNGQGQVLKYKYSLNQKEWITNYEIYLISGNHKFEIDFSYNNDKPAREQQLFNTLTSSLLLDTAYIDNNFGIMDDEGELENAVMKKSSKEYSYSISIPKAWSGIKTNFDADFVSYMTPYGYFGISAVTTDYTSSDYAEGIKKYVNSNDSDGSFGDNVKSLTTETINGLNYHVVETETLKAETPYNYIFYIVDNPNDDGLIIINVDLRKANDTQANRDKIAKVIESFTFTK
ncbi:copper amine oxidase N-terminal domain-containing protein [Paenibacillus xylaniclasticus]|uniref:copper amine oxidase N-terminal domain-containing protein n=1 Tax=Paenibacillus xylaniclasticus TaxID=588083 RepID=UPI000FDB724C|nr:MULTISPECIES: copper amine oxidase N-terminal domain-containing protein [Paenibacillus]GFN32618.1 hypothetical protein PCURB6_28780 [Paenibacillus curdlanolyticus]